MTVTQSFEARLQARVRNALAGEVQAGVLDGDVAIRAHGGRLLLQGRLPSLEAKKRAVAAASTIVPGAFTLVDNLRDVPAAHVSGDRTCIELIERLHHNDVLDNCAVAAVCSTGIVRLRRPASWADGEIVAAVCDGEAHLFGRVPCPGQGALAKATAWQCSGTANVVTKLAITGGNAGVDIDAVTAEVVWYLLRHEPSLSGNVFRVSVSGGHVSLGGCVSNHILHRVPEGTVWMVPGVRKVSNELLVTGSLD